MSDYEDSLEENISNHSYCLGDSNLLDTESPPKIFAPNSNIAIVSKAFKDYFREYFMDRNFYAITLTVSPKEHRVLKKNNVDPNTYFMIKLVDLKLGGIYVSEYTKKGIKHLHGIISVHKECAPGTAELYNKWQASCCLKFIKDVDQFNKWVLYCTKDCFSPDILKWMTIAGI